MIIRWKLLLAVPVLVLCLVAGSAGWLLHASLQQPLRVQDDAATYLLEPGAGVSQFTQSLVERSLIRHPDWSHWAARLYLHGRMIKTGEYRLRPDMRFLDLLDNVIAGAVIAHAITFPEGWNFRQFRDHLAQQKLLAQITAQWDTARLMAELGDPDAHPEGRFFPDTYEFNRGDNDLQVLSRAYNRMKKVLAAEWKERAEGLPYETEYDALIMASIIEKETGLASERTEIAGVFVRRLQAGMRLQTDPTVIYGLGENWNGNLTRKHLRTPTAYNTYVIPGLPPTPIAMPGRESIHAALHPADGKTLFFVARGDGSHHFSETLAEHEAAVEKYQVRKRARNYRSAPPGGSP